MHSMRAFTLLELLMTLLILSFLLSLGGPKLSSFIDQSETSVLQKTLVQHIAFAKSAAANSGRIVTFCPSIEYMQCEGSWTNGSMVFIDRNANRIVDVDDQILRVRSADIRNGQLEWRAFGRRRYLQFNSMGFLLHQSGNFTYCDNSGDPTLTRQLVVNGTGRVRIAIDSDGDDIREGSNGKPINCS